MSAVSSSPSPNAGRYWLVAMGLILALAGAGFTWGLYVAWQKAEETRRWTATPARIVSARVVSERPSPHSNVAHAPEIRYRYDFGGRSYTGAKIKRVEGPTAHESEAQKKVEAYPVGMEVTAYVNPADPGQAVLQHSSRAALYSIWFPLLFVAGGGGMAWGALRRRGAGG
ncbi:MAG TPA: DUF3592 domain-containing protein [Prosthecobacter sp.]|nr:DUF3592 domain-containing protein [Prosthecobacter sp.]